jgi:hypothetical protein
MSEKKEQKIAVILSLSPDDKQLILTGVKLASIFNKELCLLYNHTKKERKHAAQIKSKLIEYSLPVKTELPQLKVSTVLVSDHSCDFAEQLSDDIETILFVARKVDFKKYWRAITRSPVPFLFIDEKQEKPAEFKNLVLQIDLRKEISDSALWSSYFGRFNQSNIAIVAASDKTKDAKNQVAKNVALTKTLYGKFNIKHKVFKGSKSSFRNAFEALDFAKSSNSDVFVLLASSTITPIDYLVGLPERKIIKHAENLAVLVVNPKRDNYVLCD